jgi:hypothetical protein
LNTAESPTSESAPPGARIERPFAGRWTDLAIVILAPVGLWLFWSQYSTLSAWSWAYESTENLRSGRNPVAPDYDLTTLPWQLSGPRVFTVNQGTLTLITNTDSYAYQASATVATHSADVAYLRFDGDLEAGGASVGLLQAGKWLTLASCLKPGPCSGAVWSPMRSGDSVSVVIANNNAAGESRLIVKSLLLFFRK